MAHFRSYDGAELGYRVVGEGPALVCLPGGPGRSVDYLGDLGGLAATRTLIQLDLRGVGRSGGAHDPATLRVDRLVDDVEALRRHLDLDRMDLLAHSAGAILATLYAAAHPARLARLYLITPNLATIGIAPTVDWDDVLARAAGEPWFDPAATALAALQNGDLSVESFRASRPFFYRRWDEAAREHAALGLDERYLPARLGYAADLDLDPAQIRTALGALTAEVLILVGALDPLVTPAMAAAAAPLLGARVVVQPDAGHFPWVDDGPAFASRVANDDD